ncbi:hypothetical protein M3221_13555 [Domibacillus indicus]|uniref:hypothetical protein n=1 Tax=Domibacillus indicus TaxID=1437523 RepID=UPI00203AB0BB|nr:hypothetical protein [Domibacillus indicus]MCM3789426.1 hypothetical protein [Domibacillus indicus]
MNFVQEIDALQRWLFKTAGLRSYQLSEAPPKVARPVVLWEIPSRSSGRYWDNYTRLKTAAQYGKLYVQNLQEYGELISKLEQDLHDKMNEIPVYETSDASASIIGYLIDVDLETSTAQNLDVPIVVRYNAVHEREQPELPGPATAVHSRVIVKPIN